MNTPHDRIPIIGQQLPVVIADHSIIAPNSVEVVFNGLSMGNSIAHLRIMDPLKARCVMVPLTIEQVGDIAATCQDIYMSAHDANKKRS